MRARFVICLALALAPLAPAAATGEALTFRVIVNGKDAATRLDRRFLADAFLKKRTRWDDDRAILPVDLKQDAAARDAFSHDVLGRDVASVRRYWAQLVFSGRGVPPPELEPEAEVVKYVATHPGAIGYVSSRAELAGVKPVEVE
jgi:ABC-type phosphate transport system substrate-binding protein